MVKASPGKRSASRSSKARSKGKIGPSIHDMPLPRRTSFEDVWDEFLSDLETQLMESLSSKDKLPPYHQPASVIKRLAYDFVLNNRKYRGSTIPTAINNFRIRVEKAKPPSETCPIRTIRKPYENNEFHWVLIGLKSAFTQKLFIEDFSFTLETYDISRYAIQLKYALDHDVPPEYLIGFLYQSGTFPEIAEKSRIKYFEKWHRAKHAK